MKKEVDIEFKEVKVRKNLSGKIFGDLEAIKPVGVSTKTHRTTVYLCKCIMCNKISYQYSTNLKGFRHCMFCNPPQKTHGMTKTKEYKIWAGMKRRCNSKVEENYPLYGGRGIKVCEKWLKFENFYRDMGDAPSDQHTIDRLDCDGNYDPDNCRWATWEEQQRNRRNNHLIVYNGQTKTIAEWAEITGINRANIWWRNNQGWSVERIFTDADHRYKKV